MSHLYFITSTSTPTLPSVKELMQLTQQHRYRYVRSEDAWPETYLRESALLEKAHLVVHPTPLGAYSNDRTSSPEPSRHLSNDRQDDALVFNHNR